MICMIYLEAFAIGKSAIKLLYCLSFRTLLVLFIRVYVVRYRVSAFFVLLTKNRAIQAQA